jgi:lipopolysaccharide transport system permease protein
MINYSAKKQSFGAYLKNSWHHRHLIMTFVRRDLKIKYAQTLIGLSWSLAQPIAMAFVYYIFFQYVFPMKTTIPYILFVFSGVICWNLFSSIIMQSSASIVQNEELIRKMYFPKSILLISKTLGATLDAMIGWVILLFLVCITTGHIPMFFWITPFLFIPIILFALGCAFLLASISVKKRDVLIALPFLIQMAIWFTPIFYPLSALPLQLERWFVLVPLNAMMEEVRSVINDGSPNLLAFIFQFSFSLSVAVMGCFVFSRVEERMMDAI